MFALYSTVVENNAINKLKIVST